MGCLLFSLTQRHSPIGGLRYAKRNVRPGMQHVLSGQKPPPTRMSASRLQAPPGRALPYAPLLKGSTGLSAVLARDTAGSEDDESSPTP